jgi:hypothetical protein
MSWEKFTWAREKAAHPLKNPDHHVLYHNLNVEGQPAPFSSDVLHL